MAKTYYLALIPAFCLSAALAACGSDGLPSTPNVGGGSHSAGSAGQTGTAGGSQAGSGGGSNPNAGAAGMVNGSSGAAGAAGGANPSAGAGGMSSAGAGGMSGGMAGAGGSPIVPMPKGKSAGCNKLPPANDSSADSALHEVKITTTLDPIYLGPNGKLYKDNVQGVWDFQHRPYSVKLPKNYDNTKAYAVTMGGGGCGSDAGKFAGETHPNTQYQPDNTGSTIQVGLMYLNTCFDDGGSNIDNRADTPEIPYLRQVIADVEANYCVDKSLIFISGTSSGGWEAFTGGCGVADQIRAIGAVSGGLRNHRPACTGPQASIMVEGKTDGANPIGPIVPPDHSDLDSPGSAAARDEILKRNGCVAPDFVFKYDDVNGNAPHTQWDPAYPKCQQYTGCPAATPVVWCALDCGHQCDKEDPISYKAGIAKFWSSLPSRQ